MVGKREMMVLGLCTVLLFSSFVLGAEEGTNTNAVASLDTEFADAELSVGARITPDSSLYIIEDKVFSQFRDDGTNRQVKIAEVQAMIREGNVEAARTALERYNHYADNLEKEADPEQRDEARRSAAAIRNAVEEIEISEDQRAEFVDAVIEKETSIVTAVKIADKIRELCTTLSRLDPVKYEETCQTGDDGPRWKQKLDKTLTAEQEKEARAFFKVMSQCFKDATQCRCSEITIVAFAEKCAAVIPLATQCQKGDEAACERMDEETSDIEDLLPEHLQEVLADVEDQFGEDSHELHVPGPCREAGALDRKSCMKVMITQGGEDSPPEECRAALLEAIDRGANERELRQICEKVMFEENAPEECITAGITNHKECGAFMFKESAPQECIDAGLTGASPSDARKCQKIMEGMRGEPGREGLGGPRGGFGPDCRRIPNAEERLRCYDNALQNAEQFRDEHREEFRGDIPEECRDNPDACRERFGDRRGSSRGMPRECDGKSPEECRSLMQERFGDRPPEGEFRGEPGEEGFPQPSPEFRDGSGEFDDRSGDDFERSDDVSGGGSPDSGSSESGGEGSGESGSGGGSERSGGGGSGTTGSVISGRAIFGDHASNKFLRFFYRFR